MTVPADRISQFLAAVATTVRTVAAFRDVRLQLDPYAITDVMKENFQPPAARIFLLRSAFEPSPAQRLDLKMTVAVAVIAGRTGRANLEIAAADMAATELALSVAAVINDTPYLGLTRLTAAALEDFRPALSEKSNDKGLAITLVQFTTTLLDVIPARSGSAALIDPSDPATTSLTVNGQVLEPAP